MDTVVIVGASGYIGKNLVAEFLRLGNSNIRVLSRDRQRDIKERTYPASVEIVEGDLLDLSSLGELCEPACTVINLAYLWAAGEAQNLAAISNLTNACKAQKIRRLIHLSTAMVAGRVRTGNISEESTCNPISEYAVTKLKIERVVVEAGVDNFDTVILRPTAVFGGNSENLKKLIHDLKARKHIRNYLKSCLFGKRRMNLVHISNVIAAILFLQKSADHFKGQVLIVSDADDALNNFQDVERILMRELAIPDYALPQLQFPPYVLGWLLTLLGKDNVDPQCDYLSKKLLSLGFKKNIVFEDGLVAYAASHRSSSHH